MQKAAENLSNSSYSNLFSEKREKSLEVCHFKFRQTPMTKYFLIGKKIKTVEFRKLIQPFLVFESLTSQTTNKAAKIKSPTPPRTARMGSSPRERNKTMPGIFFILPVYLCYFELKAFFGFARIINQFCSEVIARICEFHRHRGFRHLERSVDIDSRPAGLRTNRF
jgi:hypothetical protein